MASILKKAALPVGTVATNFITAPADKQTIVINGYVANIDAVNKATHFVTIGVISGANNRVIVMDAPVAYGGALQLDKIVLAPGDILSMISTSANVLTGYLSFVEKD